jgi:GT2 family glycosyltransferase
MTNTYAPILLFVYNRPEHVRRNIQALLKNELAAESELFIYSDAAKDETSQAAVKEVRAFIRSIQGFKKITITERAENWGLARSIIDGVTTQINRYGRVIVLEDDLVVAPHFPTLSESMPFRKSEAFQRMAHELFLPSICRRSIRV